MVIEMAGFLIQFKEIKKSVERGLIWLNEGSILQVL